MVCTMVCLLEAKPEAVDSMKAKLSEVSKIFSKDTETIEWSVQQDIENPAKFCIVEKYVTRESEKLYHQENPIFEPTIAFLKENIVKPFDFFIFEQ
ncbi:hypothetical protein IAT38_008014 [Cryptococcus sp. DSM 104549]